MKWLSGFFSGLWFVMILLFIEMHIDGLSIFVHAMAEYPLWQVILGTCTCLTFVVYYNFFDRKGNKK